MGLSTQADQYIVMQIESIDFNEEILSFGYNNTATEKRFTLSIVFTVKESKEKPYTVNATNNVNIMNNDPLSNDAMLIEIKQELYDKAATSIMQILNSYEKVP